MVSKETATRIALAYREIEAAEKLLEDVKKAAERFHGTDIRDVFGRRVNGLTLGVPSGESSQKCFDVPYTVAGPVIEAHLAHQRSIIVSLSQVAIEEVRGSAPGAA